MYLCLQLILAVFLHFWLYLGRHGVYHHFDSRETAVKEGVLYLHRWMLEFCSAQYGPSSELAANSCLSLADIQSRRSERKRRSTANPQFSYGNFEPEVLFTIQKLLFLWIKCFLYCQYHSCQCWYLVMVLVAFIGQLIVFCYTLSFFFLSLCSYYMYSILNPTCVIIFLLCM